MDGELRDRLTRIETEFRLSQQHHAKELGEMKETMQALVKSQQVITNRLLKFDGGFWIIMTVAGIIGFLVSNFKHYLFGKL